MKTKLLTTLEWFNAVSIGSLVTSIGFYSAYDKWQPLVWSASVIATITIIKTVLAFMAGDE